MTGGMEHCDEMGHGTVELQGPWNIVMTKTMEHFDDNGHCDVRGNGSFR